MFSVALNWLEGVDFETEIIVHSRYVHVLVTDADQSVGDLMSKVNSFFSPFKPVEMLVFLDWAEIIAPSGYVHVFVMDADQSVGDLISKANPFFLHLSLLKCWYSQTELITPSVNH